MNRSLGLLLVGLLALGAGCDSMIGTLAPADGPHQRGPDPTRPGDPGPGTPGGPHVQNPDFPDLDCTGIACQDPRPSAPVRFARLTHTQWENAVRDLLRLDARPELSATFLRDPLSSGRFDNNTEVLEVNPRLWENYREAAETLARQVARDPQAMAKLLPDGAPDAPEARARAFVEHFGQRAYRRPLTEAEIDQHMALYRRGPELMEGDDAFVDGTELLLRLFLQSPHFIYRTELSHRDDGEVVALDAWERASKLSFALWSTMPDDVLFAAARAGELDTREGLEAHARRMLDDPRAHEVLTNFHGQLMHFDQFAEMEKDAERFPEFNARVAQDMRRELELFVKDVIFDDPVGDVATLYLAPHTFVNEPLAAIYGLTGEFGDGFERVELDPTQRAGILTRLGFLANKATAYEQNSVHRGVFINLHVLCVNLPDIPDETPLPPEVIGDTNRERVEYITESCGGFCHLQYINPAGFAFEHYNAIGGYQEYENGHRVDASGQFRFNEGPRSFRDAIEFSEHIARSPQTHECYTQQLFEYLYGRGPASEDAPLVARLAQASEAGVASIRDLVVSLVVNDIFVSRATRPNQEAL